MITLSRVAIVLVVLTLGRGALYGLMMGNVLSAAAAAIVTAAFASNWPIELSRPLRIAAFVIQIVTILVMVAAVVLLLVLSDTDWDEVPWWLWPIAATLILIIYKATAPGFALLKEKL